MDEADAHLTRQSESGRLRHGHLEGLQHRTLHAHANRLCAGAALRSAAGEAAVRRPSPNWWRTLSGATCTSRPALSAHSYLPHVLSKNGRLDIAYALLNQKTWPSWLYAVTQGATTIWERWDGWTEDNGFQDPGMNSFNHYAYGAIGAWLYNTVAGIEIDPPSRAISTSFSAPARR